MRQFCHPLINDFESANKFCNSYVGCLPSAWGNRLIYRWDKWCAKNPNRNIIPDEIHQNWLGAPETELSSRVYGLKLAEGLTLVDNSKWLAHFPGSDFPVGNFGLPLKTFRLFWNRFKLPGSERCCNNTDSERCGVDFSNNHTFYVFLSWCYDNSLKNNHWWRKSGHHLIIETVEVPECISELYFEPVPNFKNTREVLEKDEVPRARSDRTPDVLDKIEN